MRFGQRFTLPLLGTRISLPKTSIIHIQQSARRVSSILTLRMAVSLALAVFTVVPL